jgi:RimJ/RimL family protein N-acetyltransferase
MIARIPEVLETERLRARRLTRNDIGALIVMEQDPRVYPTLWGGPEPPSEPEIRAGHERRMIHWREHGFGLWLLRDRATGEFVGRGGLQYTRAIGVVDVEAAWAIVPERRGEGLATELGGAAVDVAFAGLGLATLIAITTHGNAASRRVMDKTGFRYERDVVHADLPHVLYRLAKPGT